MFCLASGDKLTEYGYLLFGKNNSFTLGGRNEFGYFFVVSEVL